jgi:hypothetical protein
LQVLRVAQLPICRIMVGDRAQKLLVASQLPWQSVELCVVPQADDLDPLGHTRSSAGFITTTSGLRFLVSILIGFPGSILCIIWSRKMNVCAIAAAT